MARAYLNSLSFPAESLEESALLLTQLRSGIAHLISNGTITLPIMCSVTASKLALSNDYKLLAHAATLQGGRFRDTVLFFLTTLDQRTPAQSALDPELQAEMDPHVVDENLRSKFDPDSGSVLVACALDRGALLSIGSQTRWKSQRFSFDMMTATSDEVNSVEIDNVWNLDTAQALSTRSLEERNRHCFDNWDTLTGGALKAPQVDEWFEFCKTRPGLEQLIMRSVATAHTENYCVDGDLVKKLDTKAKRALFEIRAYFNGSNNVRLLFSRDDDGRAIYGFGGLKARPDWYKTANPQAISSIKSLLK